MKCPEKYRVIQQNIRQPILDDDNIVRGMCSMGQRKANVQESR